MRNYGIMQGRLTEPKGRGIQFFPFDNWQEEFYMAQQIGLQEIEFIFDYDSFEKNPLWTEKGIQKLRSTISNSEVCVLSVCFDYFMRRPFYKADKLEKSVLREENKTILIHIMDSMEQLGIKLVEIPLVDNSSLSTDEEKNLFFEFLKEIEKETFSLYPDIRIGLETDLPPQDFLIYLNRFNSKRIGANYDSGNSSGLGYNLYQEVTTLREKIFNIHIKDRVYKGITVKLGTGSADFESLFEGLKEIDYQGAFILQAARDLDGKEKDNIKLQLAFLKNFTKKYCL